MTGRGNINIIITIIISIIITIIAGLLDSRDPGPVAVSTLTRGHGLNLAQLSLNRSEEVG